MGRVRATAATADAIRRWRPRYVVLVGIAGGIAARGVKLGDVVVSSQVVDYELQKQTPDGDEIRWEVHQADPRLVAAARDFTSNSWQELMDVKRPAQGTPRRHIGPVASGDKVIALGKVLAKYRQDFPTLLGVEMEAAGVATACFQASEAPGFFMVRGISDLADERKDSEAVREWRGYACHVAASYAVELLKSGPVPVPSRRERDPKPGRKNLPPESTVDLPELLVRSGRASQFDRTALCIGIGIDPNTLEFLSGTAPQAFAQQLVFWLKQTGNKQVLEKLCDVLRPAFQGGEYEKDLARVRDQIVG
jgi:nucleoside phosphorylase